MPSLRSRLRRWLARESDPVPDGGVAVESGADGDAAVSVEGSADEESELNVDDDLLLDGVGSAVFMIDADGRITAWNRAIEDLTGASSEEAIGHPHASEMFYPDGRRAKTLADKVLEHPQTTHIEHGVDLADEELPLFADTSVMTDQYGEDRHIYFTATPLYEDDELVAVIETVQDRTEEIERQQAVEALVDELQGTIEQLVAGDLAARAEYVDDDDRLDDRLLGVVDQLNEMAESFESTAIGVDEQTAVIEESVDEAVDAAGEIARNVTEQNELLTEGVSEMQTFSASMEEVAATAEEVDTAAEQAREAASEGLDASEDAREATDDVTEIGEELVDSVTSLGDRMDDIESVVEVISDVAEQTNLLALNANIEAARAGKDGDGFAVVAEEVKTLADETRQHTEQITGSIEQLQNQTDSTVVAAEQSHQQIDHAADQIDDVLEAFDDIASSIDQAADGIAEVSRATDDQATTVEELTATIEDVRERSGETEAAADRIVAATDQQTDAIEDLSAQVSELRGRTAATDGGRLRLATGVGGHSERGRRGRTDDRDDDEHRYRTDGGTETRGSETVADVEEDLGGFQFG